MNRERSDGPMVTVRDANLPQDAPQIIGIDTSFTTDSIYLVDRNGGSGLGRRTDRGFMAAAYQAWNRRATIWHLYVDSAHRRQGIGQLLVDRARSYGVSKGALNLWLETSSLNAPGVQAYRRLAFDLCGMDTTLYDGTPA